MNFRNFFGEQDYILFDGAIGTQTYIKGISKGHCYDELNISMPEVVLDIHQEYIQAGANVITTNTFGANSFILEEFFSLGPKAREINYYGARLARRAAKDNVYVAGSMGPISRPLGREKRIAEEEKVRIFREQAEALLEGGVDLLLFETFADLDELLLGIQTVKALQKDMFIIAEMSFPNNGLTLFGKNPYDVTLKLDSTEADVLGSNCGTGPQSVFQAVRKMGSVTAKELSAMPNAGLAQFVQGRFYYPSNPDYFGKYGKRFLEAGVKILGGCCGTTPEHIRALSQALEGMKPRQRKKISIEVSEQKDVRKEEKITSNLQQMLLKKGVIALEVDPPKDPDFEKFLKKLEPYTKDIDVLNVSDSPMARPRMSPISTGKLLQEKLGKEIIVHYTCRDRNILGIQSDLLGASALGLENFLALGGDPPSIGDYPFATGVYDLTSEGMVEMMAALNQGLDILGNPVGKQTHFFIGVGMGIGFEQEEEIEKARKKIGKGAHFIITQPIFDTEASCQTLRSFQKKGIIVIPSVLPLVSFKNAEYLHYEVPGIVIPDDILYRMEQKKGKEAEKEGIHIAKEIFARLQPCSNGVLLMPPLGKYNLLESILS